MPLAWQSARGFAETRYYPWYDGIHELGGLNQIATPRNDVSPNLDTGAHPSFAHTPENKEVRDRGAEAIAAFHERVLFHPLFFTLDIEQPGRMVSSFHPISP